MSHHITTLTHEDVDLEISYNYYEGSRGARERGTGLQLEPDEEPSVEIDRIEIKDIDVTSLLEFLHPVFEEKLISNHED